MNAGACVRGVVCLCLAGAALQPQVIQFESNGLKYQTLTRRGVTVMIAQLPFDWRDFTVLQVAVANGSQAPYVIRPEDFALLGADGARLRAQPARDVVSLMLAKGNRNDVIQLVSAYEESVYNVGRIKSTNGYEARRRAAMAEFTSTRLKAAGAASAIALVQTKLRPGESTDGAVFFPAAARRPQPARLVVQTNTDTFEFAPLP